MKISRFYIILSVLFFGMTIDCSRDPEIIGEYAPKDAYLEGSKHAYYGSENAWNRRFFYNHIKNYYKRRGQRQMLDMVEGRTKDAARYCEKLLKDDPDDLESLFNLAVAQARLGKIDQAMDHIKLAVEKGLPFERFLAGPRDILAPLTESSSYQEYAKQFPAQLIHGPLVGCVTDNSAKFWLRTRQESPVQVVLSRSKDMKKAIQSEIRQSESEKDFTVIVDVKGLTPASLYYYRVLIDGKPVNQSKVWSFRTNPRTGSQAVFKVSFGGGGGFVPPHERIWDVILNQQPQAFLFMGDNVYINMPEMPNGVHYYTYYRRQSRPEFRRLVSSTSIYAIWDDHDAATDDVWLGPYREKPPWKMPLLEIFKENWNNPGYGNPEWPGCWFSFSIADVDFLMLDGRCYRTNPYGENPTMLGPVQKAWLLESLQKSKGTFKVIASPVPWSLATKGEAHDTWNGFKEERREIFDFLADHRIDGVILISADRHRSDAWKIERENGYPLYEFESSRLTNEHVHELMPEALFGYNEKNSFGLLTFDTKKSDPTVKYEIVNIDGQFIHSIEVRKSEISH